MRESRPSAAAVQLGTAFLVLLVVAPFAVTMNDIAVDPSDPGFGSRDFPRLVVYLTVAASILLLAKALYRLKDDHPMDVHWRSFYAEAKAVGAIAVAALLYVWFITLFQYAIPTLLVMMFTVRYFGSRGVFRILLIPVVAVSVYYLVFFVVFGLYEEPGILLSYDGYSFAKSVRDAIGLR